jgi:hypothetical protein
VGREKGKWLAVKVVPRGRTEGADASAGLCGNVNAMGRRTGDSAYVRSGDEQTSRLSHVCVGEL